MGSSRALRVRSADPSRHRHHLEPRAVDAALGAFMTLTLVVVIAADVDATGRSGPLAHLFAVGFGLVLLARRRAPRAVLGLTVAAVFVYYVFGLPPIGIALPAVAALYSGAETGRTRWAIAAGAVLTGVAAYFRIEEGLPTTYVGSYDFLTNLALVAAAIALGVSVRSRREARVHAERLRALMAVEQAREAEHRVTTERVRMARDLHDLIGHTLSVIAVHGHVAGEAIGRDDAVAARAVRQIDEATSVTMHELRSMVRLLSSSRAAAGTTTSPERGAVGLSGLDRLARGAEDAGLAVALVVEVDPGQVDGAIEAAAYRIVQESLTNVIRHARASHVRVVVRRHGPRIRVTVADDGRGPHVGGARPGGADDRGAGGRGIAGMVERATLVGGNVTVVDGDPTGCVVRADLPLRLTGSPTDRLTD